MSRSKGGTEALRAGYSERGLTQEKVPMRGGKKIACPSKKQEPRTNGLRVMKGGPDHFFRDVEPLREEERDPLREDERRIGVEPPPRGVAGRDGRRSAVMPTAA